MTQRIPLDHLTHDQLDALYDRLDLLQRGAAERSALLEEARDALEAAGITDAHGGESWPQLVPAIEHLAKQAARAEQAVAHVAALDAADSADAAAGSYACRAERAEAALDRVRALHRKANNGETCVYCAHGQRLGYDTTWPCDTIRTIDQAQQPTT